MRLHKDILGRAEHEAQVFNETATFSLVVPQGQYCYNVCNISVVPPSVFNDIEMQGF